MSLSLDIIRTHMGKKQANAHDVFFVGRGHLYGGLSWIRREMNYLKA